MERLKILTWDVQMPQTKIKSYSNINLGLYGSIS